MEIEPQNTSINSYLFNKTHIHDIEENKYVIENYPIVYIIYDINLKTAYVGETINAVNRFKSHLSNAQKNALSNIYVISSPYFNKSATLDIESNLIKYMSGDGEYELLNANAGLVEHSYFQRKIYFDIFLDLWDKLKLEKVVTKDVLAIDNSDLFKYSPYKSLNSDQKQAIKEFLLALLGNDNTTVFVNGSAGTGKTVVAVYLMKLLTTEINFEDYDELNSDEIEELELAKKVQEKFPNLKIGLVVPMTSLRKTIKNVFKNIRGLKSSMVMNASDASRGNYDILIVDEAHRLKQRKALTGYGSFDNTNKRLGLDLDKGTELDWVLMSSKNQLFFYDANQSIKPSDVEVERFNELKDKKETITIELKSQLRSKGGLDYVKFVHELLHNTKSNYLKKWKSEEYELKLFYSFKDMFDLLNEKEAKYGLSRIISGYSWEWVSNKRNQPDLTLDGVDLYWNREQEDWINSIQSMNEMGCIHTTQGYDLNYSAIIFGSEIIFNDETNEIEIVRENYKDKKAKQGVDDIENLHEYILNIYETLLLRSIKGTYIYVVDDKLRNYFSNYIETVL